MPPMRNISRLVSTLAAAGLLAATACSPAEEPSSAPAQAEQCSKDSLPTLTKGAITFGTDQPVYPPWFVDDDPENGQGFECAVAYAIAENLGYPKDEVAWVRVPFNAAIAPGPKTFDVNLNEFSITDERKQAVDFSAPYYDVKQAVVALKSSPAARVTSLDGPQGPQARRAGRHHQLHRRQGDRPGRRGVQHQRRRQGRAVQRPGRRAGRGPADRVLHPSPN